jgi:hypothetical protein
MIFLCVSAILLKESSIWRMIAMLCASTPAAHPTAPTPADIARRNGALSEGPTTQAGKARSALNAIRHGICARSAAPVEPEDAAAQAALRAAMLARHQPLDEAEAHWVAELVFVAWRQRRLRVLEDAVLAQIGAEPGPALPALATLIRHRGRLDRDWRRAGEELTALRRGRKGMVDPAQLRWLAGRLDQAQAAPTAPAHNTPNRTNELSRACTNEPAHATPQPVPTGANGSAAPSTNEPRHAVPPLPEPAADEPPRAIQPRNRHERRRLAALQRRAA